MGGQRARARPHTVPSRFSNRRDEDFVENNEDRDRDRDDEENSYYSDRGDDSHGDRGPLRENGSNSSTRGSGIKKRSNNNNSSSSSGAGSAAHRRQGGFDDRDRDRDSAEDTLAMQTMSLIHGQLTAMKHQLLTISDISKAPESDDASQSLNQGQGPPPPSQNSFFRSASSPSSHLIPYHLIFTLRYTSPDSNSCSVLFCTFHLIIDFQTYLESFKCPHSLPIHHF